MSIAFIGLFELLLLLFVLPIVAIAVLLVLYYVIRLAVRHGMRDAGHRQ